MDTQLRHIAVSGNIGSGKTTLVAKLAVHYGWEPLYETVDQNPYLKDFYADMTRWAFHTQMYFLNSRFNQIRQIHNSKKTIIQDRTLYEDAHIFAANLHTSGHINEQDYQTYLNVFNTMISSVHPPDLLIYLRADIPKLAEQIQKRGRDFEYTMGLDYLKNLNDHYERWIGNYHEGKALIVDVNALDFVERAEDFSTVVGRIDLELNSLFSARHPDPNAKP
jgi:deoxyadenosine/deoxycytidine kinase